MSFIFITLDLVHSSDWKFIWSNYRPDIYHCVLRFISCEWTSKWCLWKLMHLVRSSTMWYQWNCKSAENLCGKITHVFDYHSEIILCMRPANERWRYSVTPSLIGWVHPLWQVHPWITTCWPLTYVGGLWIVEKIFYVTLFKCIFEMFNSFWLNDAIWWQWPWSTLAQVMACCLES